MSDATIVPHIPESAPFTPEQRAYLNGFLAGLFSRVPMDTQSLVNGAGSATPLQPLTILFGSQTGNAEGLTKRVAKEAAKRGFSPRVFEMAQYPAEKLQAEKNLLIITSTYGDGDPPDNAKAFLDFLNKETALKLAGLKFSVLALGDANYAKFCECGKSFDARLEQLGACRAHPRVDCDVDYEEPFEAWLDGALAALKEGPSSIIELAQREHRRRPQSAPSGACAEPGYGKSEPFPASLLTNQKLNGPGSSKETRHFAIALGKSDLAYEPGDALGVMPTNCPQLVAEVLAALGCSGEETVPGRDACEVELRQALLGHYEITKIPQPLLKAMAERTGAALLKQLTTPTVNGELTQFLSGREIIDLLLAYPSAKFSPKEFVSLLRKLQPRLYSISSSPRARAGEVHLTVSVVRYESLGRRRKGVCSTFLAERLRGGMPVPVFIQENKNFRPPADAACPMIMVGPGTGIAPFRAFLEERRILGSAGKNWLFFGDQRAATDFLYRKELESMLREGTLTRLDTAFSRDQEHKIYVQDRMLEHASELFDWLEKGAHFYVCGDASRMAKDVEAALHRVIQTAGGFSSDGAADYVAKLKSERRYQRDVY